MVSVRAANDLDITMRELSAVVDSIAVLMIEYGNIGRLGMMKAYMARVEKCLEEMNSLVGIGQDMLVLAYAMPEPPVLT